MNIIKQIFKDDCKSLITHFFALVIVGGLCLLPALYAWLNIYSNWDPYGSTGGLKLAAISLDEGCEYNGEYENVGAGIIDQLHDNTSVDWQFVDTKEQALEGVESGKYYAAVVIDEKFTYNMYNVFEDDAVEPTLYFYQNQKKNPVATKITDTVVGTLENNINEAFVEVITKMLFSEANSVYEELEQHGGVDTVIEKLKNINRDLKDFKDILNSIEAADEVLKAAIESSGSDVANLQDQTVDAAGSLKDSASAIANAKMTLDSYSRDVSSVLTSATYRLNSMQSAITAAQYARNVEELTRYTNVAYKDATALANDMYALYTANGIVNPSNGAVIPGVVIPDSAEAALEKAYDSASDVAETLGTIIATSGNKINSSVSYTSQSVDETFSGITHVLQNLNDTINGDVVPQLDETMDSLVVVVDNLSDTMIELSKTFDKMGTTFSALTTTIDATNVSLYKTGQAIDAISDKLTSIIDKVESATADERINVLVKTLSGDPEAYGEFFSEPVAIETNTIFPVSNYGSAVAPFYTTLAIWVGGLVLAALIKVHPDKEKYKGATETQTYFGRYILYWVLGQIQAVIIVIGDLKILKIQCLNEGYFMLAASMASTVFTLLIYSLVVTIGDVGKALSVVIVVLQIAGSSGTYPIELLPEFFQKIYIFFPFPYAINAMREAICGMYENHYVIYLLQLSLFIIVSLIIGIAVRVPFRELNHYMEERMEETEMM